MQNFMFLNWILKFYFPQILYLIFIKLLLGNFMIGLENGELKAWIEKESGKTFNYNTLLFYCIRNFSSSVKVARKSHVKKDENQGDAFKKTLDKSANK